MVVDIFVAMFGIATVLTAHTYFYINAYSRDHGFTGLLKKEEKILMNSMLAVGGLQALYFLWSYIRAAFGTSFITGKVAVHSMALGLLILFTFHSYLLIRNMKKIQENYGIEVDWG